MTALGGGATVAWVLISMGRSMELYGPPPRHVVGELVCVSLPFACTALCTFLAVRSSLKEWDAARWFSRHVWYGAVNGLAWVVLAAVGSLVASAGDMTLSLFGICAVIIVIVGASAGGAILGSAFFAGYLPVLLAAQRADGSHDRITHMIPRAAIWLTVIAAVIGQLGATRPILAAACCTVALGLVVWALRRDVGRLRLLRVTARDETAAARRGGAEYRVIDGQTEECLPLVSGVVPVRTLASAHLSGDGAFREADSLQPLATLSGDLDIERRIIARRIARLLLVLAASACTLAAVAWAASQL